MLKIIVVGLGSMGKRRIRNLLKLGYCDIIGFDPRDDRRKETRKKYKIDSVSTIEEGLECRPNVMIISTPPDLHYTYAKIAIKNNIHFFTEVNLSSKDVKKIIQKLKNKSIIGMPSCTTLYNPVFKELNKMIKKKSLGKIFTMYHHFGHFLPNWHPWEDYRKFYVSKKETGAAREVVPFELIWIIALFSKIKSVYGQNSKISKLKTNIDDIYEILIEFRNGIHGILVIDVLSSPSFSETKIIGEKGVILCDHNTGIMKLGNDGKWKTRQLQMGRMEKGYKGNTATELQYEEEIQNFLNVVIKKKKYPYTFNDELEILKVLDAVELSNKQRKKIQIK